MDHATGRDLALGAILEAVLALKANLEVRLDLDNARQRDGGWEVCEEARQWVLSKLEE